MGKGKQSGPTKVAKEAKKERESDSSEEEESVFDESSDEEEDMDETQVIDGLSSVISKIVNQKVTKDVPVLEKRKTTNVQKDEKEQEEDAPKKKKKKRTVAEPEDEETIQARALASLTKERNLKKIANKGVVALFNAIMESKRKREEEEDGGKIDSGKATETEKKKEINENVKKLTKSKFLNLLTGKETGSVDTGKKESNEAAKGGDSKGWDVLKDDADFHESNQLMLRDWDKDDED